MPFLFNPNAQDGRVSCTAEELGTWTKTLMFSPSYMNKNVCMTTATKILYKATTNRHHNYIDYTCVATYVAMATAVTCLYYIRSLICNSSTIGQPAKIV